MKQVKSIAASLFILFAATSCKKENTTAPTPAGTSSKLSKIEVAGSSWTQSFTYNTAGRLTSVKDNTFTNNYTYTPTQFGLEILNNNVKYVDFANTVFVSNKLTNFDSRTYNTSGAVSGTDAITLQYDANGYQVKKAYGAYEYIFSIVGGNTIGNTQTNSVSGSTRNVTIEYYTDKPNKLNLNLFENWFQDQYFSDMEVFGKKNSNLPKKYSYFSTTYTQVTDLTYVLDANGLPVQITATSVTNGGTATVTDYKLTFQ